jgi:hypothetical protein
MYTLCLLWYCWVQSAEGGVDKMLHYQKCHTYLYIVMSPVLPVTLQKTLFWICSSFNNVSVLHAVYKFNRYRFLAFDSSFRMFVVYLIHSCPKLRIWCESVIYYYCYYYYSLKMWLLVRKRTIPIEWPPLVGEVSANFCGERVSRGQRNGFPRPLISVF